MRYRFGGVEVDTDAYELRSGGRRVDVEPQVFDVLALLLAHRERVVSKEELIDTVWGDRFVSESALTTRVKQARQAVGDDGAAQRVIRTVRGRGYRFVAPLEEASEPPSPPTHYVSNDGASIAYQVFGDGPDLVLIEGFTTNVEVQWEHPAIAGFLRRLGTFCRVTVLDKRGTGLSERLGRDEVPPLERRADDVRAVLDAVGVDRATVFGSSEGGSLAVLLAAAHPERVERLVLHGTWARHPWLGQPDRPEFAAVERRWGTGRILALVSDTMAGTEAGRRFLGRLERQAATPGTARRLVEMMSAIDVTAILPSIRVPTLVVHRVGDPVYGITNAHDLVAGIPDARLVELPGTDHFLFSGDTTPILDAVRDFVVGGPTAPAEPDRFLATVLVADAVGPAGATDPHRPGPDRDRAEADRDRPDADLMVAARRCVEAHHGRVVRVSGDRLLATFDGPGRAVRAACDLRDAWDRAGVGIRAGVHTAEIERRGDDLAGVGIDVTGDLATAAAPGSIRVSRTVTDLVAGYGLAFVACGEHQVEGLPHPWTVYEVVA